MADKKDRKVIIIFAVFGFIWLAAAVYVIPRVYGPFITPDEFGYWAHAARFAGYDWSEAVSLFSYYSFGYGLFICPFFKLIQNPVILYRTMIGIHFLLAWAASFFIYKVLIELLPHVERKRVAVISEAAMLYVAYSTYAQTTFCESLLVFLYVLEAYAVCRWFRKTSYGNMVFVLSVSGYMYAVHMRTVGILLTTVGGLLLFAVFSRGNKRQKAVIGIILVLLCAILIAVGVVKENWITMVGSADYVERAKTNSYAGQVDKLKSQLSFSGVYYLLSSLCGKIFYMGCATFGIYFWGMRYLIKELLQAVKKCRPRQEISSREKLAVWLLLSHLGSLLVAVIAGAGAGGRMDSILYGRYFENSIPFILALGIYALMKEGVFSQKLIPYVGIQSILFFSAFFLVRNGDYTTFNNHSVTGILYAAVLAKRYDNYILLYAFVGGLAGCLLLLSASRVSIKSRLWMAPCITFCILQLSLTFFTTKYFILSGSELREENSKMLLQASELLEDREGIFLLDDTKKAVCFAQFMLREPLQIRYVEDYLQNPQAVDKESVVVTRRYSEAEDLLKEQYSDVLQSPSYAVFYNEAP